MPLILCDFDHHCRRIVASRLGNGRFDESFCRVDVLHLVSRMSDDLLDASIPQPVGHPIRTENDAVARLAGNLPDMRCDGLVTSPECLRKGILARMISGFALVELTVSAKPADVRMVVRDLFEPTFARQPIDPAVSDVSEVHPP